MSVSKGTMALEAGQYIEEPWDVIQSYFRGNHLERLVRHQLESYNDFVNQQIPKTIEMFNPVKIASEKSASTKEEPLKLVSLMLAF